MVRWLPIVAPLLVGCNRPPDAPQELEELCSYLYGHLPDDDPAALEAGVANLQVWLQAHLDETTEGYTVATLDQAFLDALEGDHERDSTALIGAAVSTVSDHDVDALAEALVVGDLTQVYPDDHPLWERTHRTEPECFLRHDCEQIVFDSHSLTSMPLGLELTSDNTGHFRWVDSFEGQPTLISRAWLQGPAELNLDIFRMRDQHFLSANLPMDEGLVRLQVVWADAEVIGLDVPDSTALNMLVNGLVSKDASLYAYLDGA